MFVSVVFVANIYFNEVLFTTTYFPRYLELYINTFKCLQFPKFTIVLEKTNIFAKLVHCKQCNFEEGNAVEDNVRQNYNHNCFLSTEIIIFFIVRECLVKFCSIK